MHRQLGDPSLWLSTSTLHNNNNNNNKVDLFYAMVVVRYYLLLDTRELLCTNYEPVHSEFLKHDILGFARLESKTIVFTSYCSLS